MDNTIKANKRYLEEHMLLLKRHYREFIKQRDNVGKTMACKDCMHKHLLAISGYAKRALTDVPENSENWEKIIAWANKMLAELPELKCETAEEEAHIQDNITEIDNLWVGIDPTWLEAPDNPEPVRECFLCKNRAMVS